MSTSTHLREEVKDALKKCSEEEKKSMSLLIAEAVEDMLKSKGYPMVRKAKDLTKEPPLPYEETNEGSADPVQR